MSVSDTQAASSSTATGVREVDPLLKDLSEKKQSFRRNVVSLAAELKELRGRLASREQCFLRESQTRQEAEARAKIMEEEINRLQMNLEDRNVQLQASTSAADMLMQRHLYKFITSMRQRADITTD